MSFEARKKYLSSFLQKQWVANCPECFTHFGASGGDFPSAQTAFRDQKMASEGPENIRAGSPKKAFFKHPISNPFGALRVE